VRVEFECIICGDTATATVDAATDGDGPLRTLRECPTCGIETIWIES
jgi:predicted RNA-binding Zn-ribbon protein involved in translation (DUF1610 family)